MKIFLFLFVLLFFFCSCNDISNRRAVIPEELPHSSTRQIIMPAEEEIETYPTFIFYERDEIFLYSCVFIGDENFIGILESGLLTGRQVFAKENASVIGITEELFTLTSDGSEAGILTILVNENPANIVILLGANDVPDSNPETFSDEYKKFISLIKTYIPNVNIFILSIPPSSFNNHIINAFNIELKSTVEDFHDNETRFVDLDDELKNLQGKLKSRYAANDGTSLTEAGWYAVLWQLCNSIK